MMAGQRLMEALIVYAKINVPVNVNELKPKKEAANEEAEEKPKQWRALNCVNIEKELHANKKLISMTMGEEGNSSGSDSEPSADNLEEEEMAKVMPMKEKPPKKEPVKKPVVQPPPKKPPAPIPKKP